MKARAVDRVTELDFAIADCRPRPLEVAVLMARPTFFDVTYVINPHMAGNVGNVDQALAQEQWQALVDTYDRLGFVVHLIDGVEGLPDLVFTANQSFPGQLSDGRWVAVRSFMHNEQRRPEVPVVGDWYRRCGATMLDLAEQVIPFEAMGDGHWVPGRRLVIGGYGFRTRREAWDRIAAIFEIPVVALRLVDENFYHLDTCLQPLDSRTALIVEEAFDAEGLALIDALFERVIRVPYDEAAERLACNGHCPDGRHFVVQRGATVTNARVREAGFEVLEVDTSEFLKSGGSVFCMKLMIP